VQQECFAELYISSQLGRFFSVFSGDPRLG
jgi:hypothetical protein